MASLTFLKGTDMLDKKHPVLAAVAACSSPPHYSTKNEMVVAVGAVLRRHGFLLDDLADFGGDVGSAIVEFFDAGALGSPTGRVCISWRRLIGFYSARVCLQ